MLKLIEVTKCGEESELIASLDVTENTEEERQEILDAIKVLYPDCRYTWHDCGHLDGTPCITIAA